MERYKRIGRAIVASGLSQGISSISNFLLSIVLVRMLSPADFGIYSIGFAMVLLYFGVGQALFQSQMTANAPDKSPEERNPYLSNVFAGVAIFCLLTLVLACFIVAALHLLGRADPNLLLSGVCFAALGGAYQLKNFFIAYSYLAKKEVIALVINLSVALALLLFISLLITAGGLLSVKTAAIAYAIALLIGAGCGLFLSEISTTLFSKDCLKSDMRECWENGGWALAGVFVSWLQSQAYIAIVAVMLGPAEVGLANAARLFITPFTFILPALVQIMLPRLAERRVSDRRAVVRIGTLYVFALLSLAVLYIVCLYLGLDLFSGILLKSEYASAKSLVWVWSLVLLCQLVRTGAVTILQALKNFRGITIDNTYTSLATLMAAIIAIRFIGVQGAILSLAAGELILATLLWRRIRRTPDH